MTVQPSLMPMAPIEPYGVRGTASADGVASLHLSPGLRSWPILDADGRQVATAHGLLLEGWLGPGLACDGGSIRADTLFADPESFETMVVRGLAGSLLIETLGGPLGRRLYPDCGGTIPVVHCPETRAFGGSADQLFDDAAYTERLLPGRVERLVMGEGRGGWISGTLTAHRGVFRLLPNHYLDLRHFTAHRFWPAPALLAAPAPGLGAAADSVARHMAGFAAAAASQFRIALALTAGLDSRLVLAAFRGHTERLSCFTIDDSGAVDREVAARVCKGLGIRHRGLPVLRASEAELARWDRMVGQALRSNNREVHPTMNALDADVVMTGLFGEPARCFLYAHDWQQVNAIPADALSILGRLKQPRDAELEADTDAWLDPIRHLPRSTVFDLAYLELRMGSWAMGQGPIQKARMWSLMPFAQWPVQEAFLTLSLADRGSERLLPMIGERMWPEAMRFPINRFGDWRDHVGPFARLARPGAAKSLQRYLRKRLAR
ncbi:hypothetical protein ACUJ46_00380 [Sandaracinobacteroides sp. A072]|uniref:hypothetical protein n=1 Tax=Sandaracinobacteroides sp. A072 TaxID=3461146 RepID=UPI0040416A51